MNKIGLRIILVSLILISLPGFIFSQEINPDSGENKFKFSVDVGALIMNSNSTLDTHGKAKIKDNTEKGEAPDTVILFPLVDMRYMLAESHTQFYFGTPIESSNIALALGIVQPIPGLGIFDFSVSPSIDYSVWKNPYLENQSRKKTPVNVLTTKLKVNSVGFTPLNVEYVQQSIDVKKDDIGELYSDLKRDGLVQNLKLTYDLPLSKTSLLSPGLSVERGNIEGDSNRYEESSAILSYKKLADSYLLLFEMQSGYASFAEKHPIYNKTREDREFGCFAMIRLLDLFGDESLHSNFIIGTGVADSNIDFFDGETYFAAFTLGASF